MATRSRASHCHGGFTTTPTCQRRGPASASSGGGADGGVGHVGLLCCGVPSGHQRSTVTLVPRLLEAERVCESSTFKFRNRHHVHMQNQKRRTERTEVLQLADSHLDLLTFLKVALQNFDEGSFSRFSWRVRLDSILPTLLVLLFQLKAVLAKLFLLPAAHFWSWRRLGTYTLRYRFARRTLRCTPVPDHFWHCLDGRPFDMKPSTSNLIPSASCTPCTFSVFVPQLSILSHSCAAPLLFLA